MSSAYYSCSTMAKYVCFTTLISTVRNNYLCDKYSDTKIHKTIKENKCIDELLQGRVGRVRGSDDIPTRSNLDQVDLQGHPILCDFLTWFNVNYPNAGLNMGEIHTNDSSNSIHAPPVLFQPTNMPPDIRQVPARAVRQPRPLPPPHNPTGLVEDPSLYDDTALVSRQEVDKLVAQAKLDGRLEAEAKQQADAGKANPPASTLHADGMDNETRALFKAYMEMEAAAIVKAASDTLRTEAVHVYDVTTQALQTKATETGVIASQSLGASALAASAFVQDAAQGPMHKLMAGQAYLDYRMGEERQVRETETSRVYAQDAASQQRLHRLEEEALARKTTAQEDMTRLNAVNEEIWRRQEVLASTLVETRKQKELQQLAAKEEKNTRLEAKKQEELQLLSAKEEEKTRLEAERTENALRLAASEARIRQLQSQLEQTKLVETPVDVNPVAILKDPKDLSDEELRSQLTIFHRKMRLSGNIDFVVEEQGVETLKRKGALAERTTPDKGDHTPATDPANRKIITGKRSLVNQVQQGVQALSSLGPMFFGFVQGTTTEAKTKEAKK